MKKLISKLLFASLLSLCIAFVFGGLKFLNSEETPQEAPKAKVEPIKKAPSANIVIKNGSTFIEIKNLNLSTEEADRLKWEIEKKVELKKIPKNWDLNMNLKITDKMLSKAKIKGYSRHDDDSEYDMDTETDDHGNNHSNIKIFRDSKISKGEKFNEVVVIGGNLDFEGEADKVVVILGSAEIRPEAKINEDLVVIMGTSNVAPGAVIKGDQTTIDAGNSVRGFFKTVLIPGAIISAIALSPFVVLFKIFWWLAIFGISLLLFAIFPETTKASKDYLKENLFPSLGYGILGMLLIVPVLFFLLLSIVGIPLIPFFAVLILIIILGGYAIAAHYIGMLFPIKSLNHSDVWGLLIGVIVLGLIAFLPFLGCFLRFVALTLGFGAVFYIILKTLFRKKQNQTLPPQVTA